MATVFAMCDHSAVSAGAALVAEPGQTLQWTLDVSTDLGANTTVTCSVSVALTTQPLWTALGKTVTCLLALPAEYSTPSITTAKTKHTATATAAPGFTTGSIDTTPSSPNGTAHTGSSPIISATAVIGVSIGAGIALLGGILVRASVPRLRSHTPRRRCC